MAHVFVLALKGASTSGVQVYLVSGWHSDKIFLVSSSRRSSVGLVTDASSAPVIRDAQRWGLLNEMKSRRGCIASGPTNHIPADQKIVSNTYGPLDYVLRGVHFGRPSWNSFLRLSVHLMNHLVDAGTHQVIVVREIRLLVLLEVHSATILYRRLLRD